MEFKQKFTDSLNRWKAFWCHKVADRPPLVIRFNEDVAPQPKDAAVSDINSFERLFNLKYIHHQVKLAELQFVKRADFPDDNLPQVAAPGGLAVTGWILGAQVEMAAGIPWVRPFLNSIEDWHTIDFDAVLQRFDKVLEIDRLLTLWSGGRYAISSISLDGPADMVVRTLGEEKLALALYDNAQEVERFFTRCALLWKDLIQRKLKNIPTYGDGTVTGWNYWVPGKGTALQEDFGQMVSPLQFREKILKHDVTLTDALDSVWYHVHSGAPHMAREIASSGAFNGIQVTNDYPAGPSIQALLPTLQYIQERTCLILRKFTVDQLDSIIGHLSPNGLALDIQCYDASATDDIQMTVMSRYEATKTIQWVDDWVRKIH